MRTTDNLPRIHRHFHRRTGLLKPDDLALKIGFKNRLQPGQINVLPQRSVGQQPDIQLRPRQLPFPLLAPVGAGHELPLGFECLDKAIPRLPDPQGRPLLVKVDLRCIVIAIDQ